MRKTILLTITLGILTGCAGPSPVLYPNAHLQQVGQEQADRDIEECRRLADDYVQSDAGIKAAKSTAVGAAGGAVVGGAVGAVTGSFGRGVGIGAAAGAASGLVRGAVKASEPSPVYRSFVNRCLTERGYSPIGWQ